MANLKDIADLAGVSISTVSRALRDHQRIPPETRERIKALAREHHLQLNASARSLATRRSRTVGIVYPEFQNNFHQSAYLDLLVHDLRQNFEALDYDCLIFQALHPVSGTSNIERLVLEKKVDGLVFILSEMLAPTWDILESLQVPLVQVHSKAPGPGAALKSHLFDFFYTDNYQGGKLAGHHLIDRGCRHPLCLADEVPGPEMLDRTRGFVEALSARGVSLSSSQILACGSSFDQAYDFVRENPSAFARADGLFAHTDIMAIGALQALTDAGLSVPDDFKIIGFDDVPMARLVRPALSTIHQPREDQARLASRRLVQLMETGRPAALEQVYLAPSLVVRESS